MPKLSPTGWRLSFQITTLLTIGLLAGAAADAQRIRIPEGQFQNSPPFPTTTNAQFSGLPPIQTPVVPGANPTVVSPPLMQLPPINSVPGAIPGPGFDAYGGLGTPIPTAPWPQSPAGSGAMIYPPANSYPWVGPEAGINASPPPTFAPVNGSPNIYGPPGNGSWPNNPQAWPNQAWSRATDEWLPRLIEHPRMRYTYLYGSNGNDLEINDAELATTLTFPGCCCQRQPLRVSPGFIFHFWNGPDTAVTGVDLPAQAYSAFLSFDYLSAASRPVGAELNFTVGMYTDFAHVTTDSLRLTGVGVGWLRLNGTTTFKLGVEYLDRLEVKLLPAFGLFMMPNPDLKLDLYFPRPKIARRVPNNNNREVWGYIGGEYGGGSWTIVRASGMGDQVDINDIRVFIGREWLGPRGLTGFLEVGYVFDRQLVYRSLVDPVGIADTFMVRMGLAF